MKKENKKKVVTLSAMAALLAVVLGMGGKTYAKYFSEEKEATKSATVAKWGLILNQTSDDQNLFKNNYSDSVVALEANKVLVAPGTSGSITYTIAGTAEVDAEINISFDTFNPVYVEGTYDNKGTSTDVKYYPIVWKVDGTKIDNPDEWTGKTLTYDAKNPATYEQVTISWEWDFSNEKNNGVANGDTYDTFLGKKANDSTFAVAGLDINTELSFNLKATFTQTA